MIRTPRDMRLTAPPVMAAMLAAAAAGPLVPQAPARLSRPDAVLAQPFAMIRGIRELADGRVLVTDWIEERVVLVDARFASALTVGRTGSGPAEYRLPATLLAFRGDSSLLADLGNGRLAVLDLDGRVVRTLAADRAGLGSPRGTDREGRIYYAVPPWSPEADRTEPGSTPVMRLDPATGRAEQVAAVRGITLRSNQGPRRTPGFPFVAFAPQDAWRVTPSGAVVVVRAGDYSIERIQDGQVSRGPSHRYPGEPVRDDDRRAFVADFVARSPTSGRGPGGAMGHSPTLSADDIARMVEGNEFAPRLPPFDPAGVFLAPDEEVWVLRGRHAGDPVVYDRFGSTGRRIGGVQLDRNRRVVGVGRRHTYVAASDADGLQVLERYLRPGAGH